MINREHIDELISKFLSGEASPEEAMALEDWKQEEPENLAYYQRSEAAWNLVQPLETGNWADPQKGWEQLSARIEARKVRPLYARPAFTRIAAGLILLLGLGLGIMLLVKYKGPEAPVSYAANERALDVKLPDGSEVTVLPHSSLLADKGFGKSNRLLRLKGDASFTVMHDDAVPFIIDAGQVFIKDIGTRFTVRNSPDTDTVYVKVDEGIVLLFDSLGSALEIKAGERALYIRSRKQIVKAETPSIMPEAIRLEFSNERLGDAIAMLESAYHTSIRFEHKAVANCTITTRFEQEDLETVLGIITETLGLSYEKTPEGYLIKGRSCQP